MVHTNVLTTGSLSVASRVEATAPQRLTPSVEVIADVATFVGMASVWNETVERAAVAHPFLHHEWLRTWWDCFGAGRRLHIVVVKSAGRVLAIAPLMWETAWMYGVPVRRLRLLENAHTPRADVIVVERPLESYRAIWRSLLETSQRWDVLQLSQIDRASPTFQALQTLATDHGHATETWPCDDAPYLSLGQTWDAYSATLTPKFRQNLRNRWSRVSMLGQPKLEVLEDCSAIRDACDESLSLEASGWKHANRTAIGCDPATHRFYTQLAERAADRGWLRLLFLTVNGRRIATAYGACYRGRLMFLKTGYDPEFARCSPFKTLTSLALQHAFAEGLAEVDFLGDAEPWKLEWTSTTRPHDWLFVFGRNLRGRLVHQLKFRLKPAVKRWRDA
jgi:CelD/BcsL family acetyltransferase involved in cellulose biosynthesis